MLAKGLEVDNSMPVGHQAGPRSFDDFEFSGWQTLAGVYDGAWGHVTSGFVPPLLAALGTLQDCAVLDLATGPGYGANTARDRGARVTGVDFSPNMVARARQLYPGIRFDVADARALPYADASFDSVMSNFGVQHFSNLDAVFAEILRVLKPGGACAFTVWADNSLNAAGDVLEQAVAMHATAPTHVPSGPDYHELADETARRTFMIDHGFDAATVASEPVIVGWRLAHVHELFEAELTGSVRSGARLRAQPPHVRARIRDTMAAIIRDRYSSDGGYVLPMAAHIVSGRRA